MDPLMDSMIGMVVNAAGMQLTVKLEAALAAAVDEHENTPPEGVTVSLELPKRKAGELTAAELDKHFAGAVDDAMKENMARNKGETVRAETSYDAETSMYTVTVHMAGGTK